VHKVPSVRCLRCAAIHTAILSGIEGKPMTVEGFEGKYRRSIWLTAAHSMADFTGKCPLSPRHWPVILEKRSLCIAGIGEYAENSEGFQLPL
jgi:hypothetical protein